jgi:undecaprenyl-diphosphatase
MPEIVKAAVLGVVQGITEFLPISSSAHLLALEEILDFHLEGVAFDVSLHLATLLAVIAYFRGEILRLVRGERRLRILLCIALATAPVGVAGFLLADFRASIPPGFAVGGWLFSAAYLLATRGRGGATPYDRISAGRAVAVGCAQALSICPGVSRSGATIAAGLWLGLSREGAARFSFLIAIPAMLGAGLHEGLKLAKAPEVPDGFWALCAVGAPAALAVGLLAIHVLMKVVREDAFHRFGIYNLAAGALFGAYLLLRG